MTKRFRIVAVAAVVALAAAGGGWAAVRATHHTYTLRVGDTVRVPSVGQVCQVVDNIGLRDRPVFLCTRPSHFRLQVAFMPKRIVVLKADRLASEPPTIAFTGKP